jgi:Queuosine biosynthesis protein QueC
MLPYTLDRHFTFGYGSGIFNPEDRSHKNKLWCAYTRVERDPEAFDLEVVRVAGLLADEAVARNRKLFVFLSGGMDSEVVVKACMKAGIEFEAITFRFANGLNSHEMRFVERFVKRTGIKHRYYDMNVLEWIKTSELEDLFHGSQAASLTLLPHMKLMNHVWFELNGLPVLGNGDMYLENCSGSWNYIELEYMLSWYRHAIRFGVLGGIGFFQYTPEVSLAMLREPRIARLGRNQDPYATKMYETSKFVKYAIYRRFWPDLEMRPKFGGHEMVADVFRDRAIELIDGKSCWTDKWKISYDDFRGMLEPDEQAYQLREGLQPRQTAGQWLAGS